MEIVACLCFPSPGQDHIRGSQNRPSPHLTRRDFMNDGGSRGSTRDVVSNWHLWHNQRKKRVGPRWRYRCAHHGGVKPGGSDSPSTISCAADNIHFARVQSMFSTDKFLPWLHAQQRGCKFQGRDAVSSEQTWQYGVGSGTHKSDFNALQESLERGDALQVTRPGARAACGVVPIHCCVWIKIG